MSNRFSNIKKAFLLTAISFSTLSGLSASAAGAKAADTPAKKHYIVFHDDRQNIIKRVEVSGDYTFNADDPFFFVTMPVSNTAWSTKYMTADQIVSAGGNVSGDDVYTFATGEKLSKYNLNPLTEDLHVYPVVKYGTYIRFDSQGGTPVPYQFLHVHETMIEPESAGMVKTGYTFGGWYNTAQCLEGDVFDFSWSPVEDDIPKEKYAYAKWIPSTANYSIRVWLEKAEHPYRATLTEAKAHKFEDYAYGTLIEKTGITGGVVEFSPFDMASQEVKDVTYLDDDNKFPVFFYVRDEKDEDYDSYAYELTEASISEINTPSLLGAFKGIKPDGTTVVDVFYRRMVFDVTVGVLDKDYNGSGNPSWDSRYDHPTVTMRDGEKIGSAIERAMQKGTRVSAETISLFQSNTDAIDSDYHGFWKFTGWSGFTTGLATNFTQGGVWNEAMRSIDIYNSQAAVLTGTKPSSWESVTDKFTFYALMPTYNKVGNEFRRLFYVQTIDAAVNNRSDVTGLGGAIQTPSTNYELVETYRTWKNKTSDGFQVSSIEGFNFNLTQCVKRSNNGEGALETVNFANGGFSGNYIDFSKSGYQLEIFFKRASYTLDLVSAPGPDADMRSFNVYYEDNLSSVSPKIGGKDFVPGVTYYSDSEGKKYVFMGWYDNSAYVGNTVDFSTFSMPSHNVQLFAKWVRQEITVTFNAGDGTVGPGHTQTLSMTIDSGSIPANPGDAEPAGADGHTYFYGWLKDGVLYDFVEPLYVDTELEALYYVDPNNPFKITYKAGKGTGDDVLEFDSYGYLYNANAGFQPYDYDDYFGDWTLPKGKVFKHWSGSNGEVYDAESDPNKEIIMHDNVTLTAIYEGGKADIVIERNGLLAGESATFTVYRMEEDVPVYFLTVIVTGSESETTASRKIVNVEPGTYKVEESKWTWAYDKGDTIVTEWEKTPVTDGKGVGKGAVDYEQTLKFTFTGDPKEGVSQHGENVKYNEFSAPQGDNEIPGGGVNI